jgi:predicted Zn-dependent peptidase
MPNMISATCRVLVGTGSRNEEDYEPGISHFLEHLAFKGSETRNALDISKAIEIEGAYLNAYTSKDKTCYYAGGSFESIPKFIEILGDVICNSVFNEADIRMESGVILQEIAQSFDDVSDLGFNAYYAARHHEDGPA